ncbi:betaine/proline/choline family ABC transporter ATP-binding protein [Aureimonas fodinaquatilis]|uniref:Quaternary amine transport ATP-binding protein n=1 Tax=Aureimonas fodinaquatilis TaxID=2565783 RepID=A0A5B0DXS0_9HYPH|nr:betaine/proline/choline family ABC transporter ATP-binding protein [Aureimonas fodinaquatilis]KAA0971574.1 betaine/proline/choline family ABC transporter ATP-binding protein [Aureimonas fodinaquatilis]
MNDSQPVISCRNVWKIFGQRAPEALKAIRNEGVGKAEVLRRFECVVGVADVSFDVQRGEIFCIMGLSGSGKSTLLRHINRLIEPSDGRILIEGREINSLGAAELRMLRAQMIAMVFQSVALLPYRTVLENTALGLEFRKMPKAERLEASQRALQAVQLGDWANRYPSDLSGGMLQRVGLARALASDSPILLMDEPFSALDPLIRRELQDQFVELSRKFNKTTIFITHDLEEAIRVGNRIGIMRDGVMVQVGAPEDIVMAPADDYVARFTAGIAKNHLVSARSLMAATAEPEELSSLPRVAANADIDQLIDLFLTKECGRLAVEDETGHLIGCVTQEDLLRGIQGPKTIKASEA